ncbi:protein S40-1-like [Apium graveolens]|uniref:protein S40-1-like n=1 Tax=Apium graveolens TaxID=4045 RepID=UPI003D7B88C9
MADQEFQESEIIFEENAGQDDYDQRARDMDHWQQHVSYKKLKRNKKKKISRPVNIPENASAPAKNSCWYYNNEELFDEDDDVSVTPPHVILGRRMNGKMAFSVNTGSGRTLKGRELSYVRNSILRMTGFLES